MSSESIWIARAVKAEGQRDRMLAECEALLNELDGTTTPYTAGLSAGKYSAAMRIKTAGMINLTAPRTPTEDE